MTAPAADPVVARLLAAIRAGDPVPSGQERRAESAGDLDARIDAIVAVEPTGTLDVRGFPPPVDEARRRRRRRRFAGGALAVAALSVGSGVAARVIGRSVQNAAAPVVCSRDALPGGSAAVVSPNGDPVAACRAAWEDGVLETSDVPTTLTACVSPAGIVEVYPAGRTICTELGLSPYEGPDEAALVVGELQERLVAAAADRCAPLDEVEALARRLLVDLDLESEGWTVLRRPPPSDEWMCAGIGVDASIRTVVIVPLPKNP